MGESVRAEMVANVFQVAVAPGDAVEAGSTLLVLESMKMEMPVESPAAGKVSAVLVKEGAAVEEGAPLVEITPG